MPATHPTAEMLAAFARGKLPDSERVSIEEHISECADCCRKLEAVPEDTLEALARQAAVATLAMAGDDSVPDRSAAKPAGRIPPELRDHPRYRIVRILGTGGMGTVYQAEHRVMGRMVALKVISPKWTRNQHVLQRFEQEVRAAAKLSHPNIVTAFDAETAGGLHFLVMEYVDGVSLAHYVERRGPLPVNQACECIRRAALGLQHAYERGMVHRDIKPHNLMLTRTNQIKILDFGLARLVQDEGLDPALSRSDVRPGLTLAGSVLGTPDFIAPEQVRDSRSADIRADLYSLGCTLYFLLSGRPPFHGDLEEKLQSHCDRTPDPLDATRDDLPEGLLDVLDRLMAKHPDDRYQTPSEAAAALLPLCRADDGRGSRGEGRVAPDALTVAMDRPIRWARSKLPRANRPLMIGGVAIVLLLFLALGVRHLWTTQNSGKTADNTPKSGRPEQVQTGLVQVATGKKRILFVVPHENFWDMDYYPVRRRFDARSDVTVDVASSQDTPATSNKGQSLPVDVLLSQVDPQNYSAVVFAGRPGPVEFTSGSDQEDARRVVEALSNQGRPVASLCRGTLVLAKLGVLKGRRAQASRYLTAGGERLDDVKPLAKWNLWDKNSAPVEDGPFITAGAVDTPQIGERLADAVLRRLK